MSRKIKRAQRKLINREEELKEKFGKRRDLTAEEINEVKQFARDAKYNLSQKGEEG